MDRTFTVIAAIMGFLGVAMGAFGAHALALLAAAWAASTPSASPTSAGWARSPRSAA